MSIAARFTTAVVLLALLGSADTFAEPAPVPTPLPPPAKVPDLDPGCLLNAVGRTTTSPEGRLVLARAATGTKRSSADGLGYSLTLPDQGLEVRVGSREGVERVEAVTLGPRYSGPLPAGVRWDDFLDVPLDRMGGEVVSATGNALLKVQRGGVEILFAGVGTMRVRAIDVRWVPGSGPYEGEETCGSSCAALGVVVRAAAGDFVDVIDPATEQELFGRRQWSLRLEVPTATQATAMDALGRRWVTLTFSRTPARFGDATYRRLRGVVETCLPDGYGPGSTTADPVTDGASVTRFTRLGATRVELIWTQRADVASFEVEIRREP